MLFVIVAIIIIIIIIIVVAVIVCTILSSFLCHLQLPNCHLPQRTSYVLSSELQTSHPSKGEGKFHPKASHEGPEGKKCLAVPFL
jgi:hypothetical protein